MFFFTNVFQGVFEKTPCLMYALTFFLQFRHMELPIQHYKWQRNVQRNSTSQIFFSASTCIAQLHLFQIKKKPKKSFSFVTHCQFLPMNSKVNKSGLKTFTGSGFLILKIALFLFCHIGKGIINYMQQNCNIPSFLCETIGIQLTLAVKVLDVSSKASCLVTTFCGNNTPFPQTDASCLLDTCLGVNELDSGRPCLCCPSRVLRRLVQKSRLIF